MIRFCFFGTASAKTPSCVTLALLLTAASTQAGPFSGPNETDHAIDPAIVFDDERFVEWADAIDASRTAFAPRGSTSISTTGFNSLGDLDASEIANGDSPGFLTVTFPTGIRNGEGADFAVFENGFGFGGANGLFAELAYVEVSSNGTDFARFDSISTNTAPLGGSNPFAGYDTTNIFNLAGKHAEGFGTPFDLDELIDNNLVTANLLDLENIQYVRLVDIPGNGSFLDSQDNPILDNWLTSGTGGFDFRLPVGQGIGVLNAVPEPTSLLLLTSIGLVSMRRRNR
ncbi:MAG: PEP-CTERM sorting domain-containing protein [Planctomycetota bacterium]